MTTRSAGWLAWLLWVLTLLGLAVTAGLDHLLRLASRPELTWSQEGGAPFGVNAEPAGDLALHVVLAQPPCLLPWPPS